MKIRSIGLLLALVSMLVAVLAASEPDGSWLEKVPETDHASQSPIRNPDDAIAQGRITFRAHCAQCHGENAQGSNRAPALTTARVQQLATEGDLHWLLVNGNKERGMPAWAKLGDLEIWQVITYVRSLR
jgi:mono/diheme cytochrome c family protein